MQSFRVELLNINKSFGGINALKDVSLQARPGEIHAIVGENGAGKSTLLKILAGAYSMDSGEILIRGKRVRIDNPGQGREYGVGIIYQEFSLVPELSVAENIFLHYLNRKKFWMRWNEIRTGSENLISSLGFDIPADTKVRDLSTARQQAVEIAKAISEKVDILILDEPTAVLAPQEARKLFDLLRKLKEQGTTILYISHRLEEIFGIADRITILKDGRVTRTAGIEEIDHDSVISAMIGRKLGTLFPVRESSPGKALLEIRNLQSGRKVRKVSFTLKEGEVLGLGGLVGSGRTETLRAIFSADRRTGGEVRLDGNKTDPRSPREAVNAGIGLVPEDRKTQGVLLDLSIRINLSMTALGTVSGSFGFISGGLERQRSGDLMKSLGIRARSAQSRVSELSGGNQQKVVLAKWMGTKCRVLLMDEPTRGIDVGAKAEIYQLIRELAGSGMGIVLVSSETMELIGLCDRILVMHEGSLNGELGRNDFSEENIMRLSIAKNEHYERTGS